jgi:aldose 1-epimerase
MLTMQTDAHGAYFGCIVGRVANRIEGACFSDPVATMGGEDNMQTEFKVEANDGANHLHGGSHHWGRQEWQVEQYPSPQNPTAVFYRTSPDGESSFPGEVVAKVTYTLEPVPKMGDPSAHSSIPFARLRVTMEAITSKRTPINLVQHSHWNLCGMQAVTKVRLTPHQPFLKVNPPLPSDITYKDECASVLYVG